MKMWIAGVGGISDNHIFQGEKISKYNPDDLHQRVREYLSKIKTRRFDFLTKLFFVAAEEARKNARLENDQFFSEGLGIITAMKFGPWEATANLVDTSVSSDFTDLGPGTFPQTVVNHAAGQLCMQYHVTTYSNSIVSSYDADIQALELAEIILKMGSVNKVLLVAGDYISQTLANRINISPVCNVSALVIGVQNTTNNCFSIDQVTSSIKGANLGDKGAGILRVSSGGDANNRIKQMILRKDEIMQGRLNKLATFKGNKFNGLVTF